MEQAARIKSQFKGEGRGMPALQPCEELLVTLVLQIYPRLIKLHFHCKAGKLPVMVKWNQLSIKCQKELKSMFMFKTETFKNKGAWGAMFEQDLNEH